MLDGGSQLSFVSDNLVRKLNIPTNKLNKSSQISGTGCIPLVVTHCCELVIKSRIKAFNLNVEADVIGNMSYKAPVELLRKIKEEHQDKNFANHAVQHPDIDIILGAEYVEICLEDESMSFESLKLRRSKFGYLISGAIDSSIEMIDNNQACNIATVTIECALCRFWEIEEAALSSESSLEAETCRKHFYDNYSRLEDGRFVVKLPFKADIRKLSNTKTVAIKSLIRVECNSSPQVLADYRKFMSKYASLGHMELIPSEKLPLNHSYLIPHRGVLRTSSSTTALRVVFNASAKRADGLSLNETLMVGPKVQDDLFDILIRFRSFKLVYVADIEKMYRQVMIDPRYCYMQCILWRDSPEEDIKTYCLKTVTYGTSPASFLATNCLIVLSEELCKLCPNAGSLIRKQFYMDDLLAGANSVRVLSPTLKMFVDYLLFKLIAVTEA